MTTNSARSEYSAGQLRVLLARTGISAAELARRVGHSRNWVSGRTTGTYPITADDAIKIAQALGSSIADLLDAPPSMPYLTRLAPLLAEIQLEILDNPLSDDEVKQGLLRILRELKNLILILSDPERPDRASRKGR